MPEIVLDRSRVLAVVRKLVAAGVTQHVAVDREREARGFASPGDHPLIASHAQGRQALRHEDIDALAGVSRCSRRKARS